MCRYIRYTLASVYATNKFLGTVETFQQVLIREKHARELPRLHICPPTPYHRRRALLYSLIWQFFSAAVAAVYLDHSLRVLCAYVYNMRVYRNTMRYVFVGGLQRGPLDRESANRVKHNLL